MVVKTAKRRASVPSLPNAPSLKIAGVASKARERSVIPRIDRRHGSKTRMFTQQGSIRNKNSDILDLIKSSSIDPPNEVGLSDTIVPSPPN